MTAFAASLLPRHRPCARARIRVCRGRGGGGPSLAVGHRRRPAIVAELNSPPRNSESTGSDTAANAAVPSEGSSLEARVDPVAARVRAELAADGVNLDELLNAGKVVNLTRKLDQLSSEFDAMQAADVAGSDAARVAIVDKMDAIRKTLGTEKRQVMQSWLKRLFLVQAGLFVVIGGLLSTNAVPGVEVPLVGRALGFWSTWLFTIPALRARKGMRKAEKSALNVAFLGTPLVNVALPLATKNCGVIWAADIAFLVGAYAWYVGRAVDAGGEGGGKAPSEKEQNRVKGFLKYLDWGSFK
jgi:hypothetical protein